MDILISEIKYELDIGGWDPAYLPILSIVRAKRKKKRKKTIYYYKSKTNEYYNIDITRKITKKTSLNVLDSPTNVH